MTKPFPAVAAIEFQDIPSGIFATDAMLKKAPVAFVKSGSITRGRFLTLIGGSTASVDEAYEEGRFHGADAISDHVFLPDIAPPVFDAIFNKRHIQPDHPLAILETTSVPVLIRAAEAAVKGTPVHIAEIRLADHGLAGKGLLLLQGELHDIEAALEIAHAWTARHTHGHATSRILSRPHEALLRHLQQGTTFSNVQGLHMEGETC
ncbi:MAG TPA: BMC domain-containing protein [Kiritimatiellia bacterium]|nr:BMC domain-containing protein [Kiritimatiellia bacterium]